MLHRKKHAHGVPTEIAFAPLPIGKNANTPFRFYRQAQLALAKVASAAKRCMARILRTVIRRGGAPLARMQGGRRWQRRPMEVPDRWSAA